MKTLIIRCSTILLAVFALVGCGQSGGKAKLDAKKLETSFASAEPNIKSVVDKGLAAIKAAEYRSAFDDLAKLIDNKNLTPEQVEVVRDTLHQLSLLFPPPDPYGKITRPK